MPTSSMSMRRKRRRIRQIGQHYQARRVLAKKRSEHLLLTGRCFSNVRCFYKESFDSKLLVSVLLELIVYVYAVLCVLLCLAARLTAVSLDRHINIDANISLWLVKAN